MGNNFIVFGLICFGVGLGGGRCESKIIEEKIIME